MARSWSERGSAAVDAGDLNLAKQYFSQAVKDESRNPRHRFHLAMVLEGLGELAASARELTEALRLDPKQEDAARRLAALFRRPDFAIQDQTQLSKIGLRNGLHHKRVDQMAIANAVVHQLVSRPPLRDALAAGQIRGWLEAARSLLLVRSSPLLKDELFLDLLRTSLLSAPELERLLTAMRRVLLLELPLGRFADRALMMFAVALLEQCWINQFVWLESEEEASHLAEKAISPDMLAAGDVEQGQRLLVHCLYQPIAKTVGGRIDPTTRQGIKPDAVREIVTKHLASEQDERDRAARVPMLGVIAGETSRKVAQFYEESPYPRWSSVVVQRNYRATLGHFLGPERSAFLDQSFEVLIAGCGTGQQAVLAALHYGPKARILALDLSSASLGYASRMADAFAVENIEFARADLEQIANLGPSFAARFHIIEAVGVLHHMTDPFAAWRALLKCLTPKGLMRIGLYSAIARNNLSALHGDPAYPGPDCDDTALRHFRRVLLDRRDELARDAMKFGDFWDAKSFRDMLLHVSEHNLTLPQIASFLEEEHLAFLGFQLPKTKQALFFTRHPLESWPGSLESWAKFEEVDRALFENMYLFWCERQSAHA